MLGLGVEYALSDATSLRFELERYYNIMDDSLGGRYSAGTASLGLKVKF